MDETKPEIINDKIENAAEGGEVIGVTPLYTSGDNSDIMAKVLEFRDKAHTDNVRKLRAGIKCIFTVPACFLILLFFTNSSKIIFLVLWIVSLFLIAAYLIHVEYSDYKIQEMVNSLQDSHDNIDSLIDIDTIITNVKADAQAQLDNLAQLRANILRENETTDAPDDTKQNSENEVSEAADEGSDSDGTQDLADEGSDSDGTQDPADEGSDSDGTQDLADEGSDSDGTQDLADEGSDSDSAAPEKQEEHTS